MIAIMSELQKLVERHGRGHFLLAEGETLFRLGNPVSRLHLVLIGEIVLERHTPSGTRLVLQHSRAGEVVAEPSIFSESYHCTAIAATTATLLYAEIKTIRNHALREPAVMEALARQFARDVQSARFRAEILSLRRLSDRLDAWLEINGGLLPGKGSWLTLASDLAVAPEALYRELAKRRKELHMSRDE